MSAASPLPSPAGNPSWQPALAFESLRVGFEDGILNVVLNRPQHLNTFDEIMQREFTALQWQLERLPGLRCVLIEAEGERAFGAGADITWFERNWNPVQFRTEYRWIHDFFDMLERIEVPVIAAVFGVCACGGLELALASDFRIAAEGTRFGFTEGNINLIPGSGGCSRLARLIGEPWAKELVLAGEFIGTPQALQLGLVTRVVPRERLHDEALALAQRLLTKAPQALGTAKAVINASRHLDPQTGRVIERIAQSVLIQSEDHREGVRAFREKRPARYTGR